MSNISLLKQEKGGTAIVFLFIMSMLAALAVGSLQVTSLNLESSRAQSKGKQAFYSAEVGLDLASDAIVNSFQNLTPYTSTAQNGGDANGFITLNNYEGYDVRYRIAQSEPRFLYQTLKGQDLLTHYAYSYEIDGTATSVAGKSKETLGDRIRILETPLVQWFIFYGGEGAQGDADLEIHSGSNWTGWGRVHTNGDLYIGSTQSAFHRFQNFDPNNGNPIQTPHAITVSGEVKNFTKSSNVEINGNSYSFSVNADAEVKTSNTNTLWQDEKPINAHVTSSNEDAEETRFKDFLLALEPERSTPGPVIIERGGFYENRAINPEIAGVDGIHITGTGGLGAGNIQVLVGWPALGTDVTALIAAGQTSPGVNYIGPLPIIQEQLDDFGDCREQNRVDTTDIDLFALTSWYQQYLANPANGGGVLNPTNGFLIYASRSPSASFTNTGDPLQAIRLRAIGGASVPQVLRNTTFATDNPLYIQGDFNTVNKVGVALIADAINVLSNGWTNTKVCGGGTPYTYAETSVNAAFITGNSVTTNTFNGGAINYPRFHEWWVNTAFNYRGAFINLWTSKQASGDWCLGGDCYSAPIRNWGWETNFQNPNFWPPFIPSVYEVERVGFIE
jgi:Tfp pilus assembly protein PilX